MRLRRLVEVASAVLVLSALTPFNLNSETPASDDKEPSEIRALLQLQQDAWNRADLETFMLGYWRSPDLTFAGSAGITRGWTPVLQRYRERYRDAQAMGHLDFSNLEIHPLGSDAAFVLGRWHLNRANDEPAGVFTLILQRFPEGWRIIHDHTSVDEKSK